MDFGKMWNSWSGVCRMSIDVEVKIFQLFLRKTNISILGADNSQSHRMFVLRALEDEAGEKIIDTSLIQFTSVSGSFEKYKICHLISFSPFSYFLF